MPLQSTGCTVDNSGASTKSTEFFPVSFEKEAVDYKLRNTRLGRWSSPITKDNATLQGSPNLSGRIGNAQERVLEMTSFLSEQHRSFRAKKRAMTLNRWEDSAESRLKANYGHLLHPLEDPTAKQPHFVPTLPGISSILDAESTRIGFWTRPSLCYDFIAQPGSPNYSTDLSPNCFPKLSIIFRPDADGQHALQKITIQFGTAKYQVLLPEESVDISFEFEQSLRLNPGDLIRKLPAVDRWKDKVLQNLQSGERLTAPDIELDIPRWTVEGLEYTTKDEVIKTKYLFTGISVNQSVWAEHQGNIVVYSTNQSGKLGAKTGTLSTRFGVSLGSKKVEFTDASEAMKEFVGKAFQMAHTISQGAAASHTGMKKTIRKPTENMAAQTTKVLDSKDALPQLLDMHDAQPAVVQAENNDRRGSYDPQIIKESTNDTCIMQTSDAIAPSVPSDESMTSPEHKAAVGEAENIKD